MSSNEANKTNETNKNIKELAENVSNAAINEAYNTSVANTTNLNEKPQNLSATDDYDDDYEQSESKNTTTDFSKGTSVKKDDNIKPIDSSQITTTATSAVAESKNGGYSFVGNKIFKVTQDAANGTCVKEIGAKDIDAIFINNTKYLFENTSMSGGSKSANKKNKITCKKKGGRKHKKSMKHKKGAKKW